MAQGPAASPAVAGKIWSWDDVKVIAESTKTGKCGKQLWAVNNQALKYIRFTGEDPIGVPRPDRMCSTIALDDVFSVGQMEHAQKGPGFSFDAPAVAGGSHALEPVAVPHGTAS